ncbi:alpha/beta fold hydrolase [Variovorax sp. J22R133]|uniref:alpha/beta fold hydrolase BchO n=1 Tax=Variovorax brevis TaxID=3053503 RepID=UPI0025778C22|nr:alpha/beta fold hydrolase BchO [Variovorax sp. J22R133]MDM0113825.1 alpha/beta fold hydrolase [Variovorax sp. J22R133]
MSKAPDWDTDGGDWPNRTASVFVTAAGLRWHVQRMGSGPHLLLIHGTGSSTHSWRDFMPVLARGFSCVAVDLPGHAFTAMPPTRQLSLEGMAHGLRCLLAALDVRPSIIVGHSAGAAIAAQMCQHEGVAADVIVSLNGAFLPLSGLSGVIFPPIARVMEATGIASRLFAWHASDDATVRRLIAQTGSRLDALGVELYARLVRNPVHVSAALGMMARWDFTTLVRSLPHLAPRLQLMAAEFDCAVPPDQSVRVHKMVARSDFVLIPNAGHLAHEEKPGEVAAMVVQGIGSHERR